MALIPIMGQPVNLVPNNERAFGCEPENGYCVLYGQDEATDTDPAEAIMFEMRQTPCGDDLIIDGNFPDGSAWVVVSGDIVFAGGKATHIVGTSAELNQDITDIDLGTYYQVEVTVTDMSAGTLDIYFTQTSGYSVRITENGIYTFYLYNLTEDDGIDFVWSSDCDAAISGVSVYKLLDSTEIIATLNTIDGVFVVNMTIDLFDDYVLASVDTYTLDEGCYMVQVIDPCEVTNIGSFVERVTGGNFNSAGDWTVYAQPTGSAVVSGGQFEYDTINDGSVSYAYAVQPFAIPTGVKLLVKVVLQTGQIDAAMDGKVFVGELATYTINSFLSITPIQSNLTYTKYFILSASDLSPSYLEQGFIFDYFLGTATTGQNQILDLSIKTAEITSAGLTGVFTSNCLKVSADVSGTRKVEGFAELLDESSNPIKGRSLGFLFVDDYFWLRARLGLQFSNPHTPTSTDNNLSSNGRTKKAYAQLSKAWDLTFHAVDENMHDTIANIINCDSFQIEGNEYVTDEKEYTANYGENGINAVAESTIEVQKVDGTRFNTNQ